MKKRTILLLVALLTGYTISFAQGLVVSGTVSDAKSGDVLPGVSIAIKGTSTGAITDIDGKFRLQVPDAGSVLVFTFIGYVSQTITVNGRNSIDVQLLPDIKSLDEVVVIGYGTAKKSEISSSTVTVTEDQIKGSIVSGLDQALQGRAAGVTAIYVSGQPGAAVNVAIRGISTINAGSNQPLYVIDGVAVQNVSQSGHDIGLGDRLGNGTVQTFSGLSSINPADIVSMEILKDASATAIYGSRGSNGVILITTKRGKIGDAKFSYEGYYGVQNQVNRIDMMNLQGFAQFVNDWAAETAGRDPRVEFMDPSILGAGTNWQDELWRKAPIQNHVVSASGGTEKVTYYVSGGYFQQDGTLIATDFKRYNGRVNLNANLKKWFKLGTNLYFTNTRDHLQLNNSTEGVISIAYNFAPDIPVQNPGGDWGGVLRESAPGVINPVGKAETESLIISKNKLNANFYSDLTFFKGLTLHSELGSDINYSNAYTFIPTYQYGTLINSTNTSAHQYNQGLYWELKNYLTYTTTIRKHNITLMAGQEASESRWEYLRGSGNGLSSNDIQEPGLADPKTMAVGSGKGSNALESFYSRVSYNFADRYYLYYTFRYDGSSNFGPKNRWAPFHAASASWRISEEPLMAGYKTSISNLRIRGGWGQTGNQFIPGYLWGAAINKMPSSLGMGFRQTNLPNLYVHWEKQESTNVGMDLGLFSNRINLTVDLYKKISTDMLMDMQLPSYMGTRGNVSIQLKPPKGNFGKMENKGLEISLTTRPFVGKFSYENDIELTFNRNKLLGLNNTPAAHIDGYGQWTDLVSMTEIGQPLYNFYGYKVVGIYQDKADILNSPKTKAFPVDGNIKRTTIFPGDLKFADLSGPDGVPDGIINEFDRTDLGSPFPKFTFGFNNTFNFKNFELNVFITGSYGNKVMNYIGRSLTLMDGMWSNQKEEVMNRAKLEPIDPNKAYPYTNEYGTPINAWYEDIDNVRVANPGTKVPRAISGDPNENNRFSDRYIEDGSYLRFKNIALGYYVPKKLISRLRIDNIKVYVNVQNMWTITNYKGLDPEVGASQTNDFVYGLDNGRYPSARIFTMGLNFTF